MSKEYIYIGQYFHKHGKDLQEFGITEKKIGYTKDPDSREKGLSNTKMTIGYKYIAIWKVENMTFVEDMLHTAFGDNRLSGEWFEDPNDDLVERVNKIITKSKWGEKIYEDTIDAEEELNGLQARSEFSVVYNDKLYDSSGTQILIDVFNSVMSKIDITDDYIEKFPRMLRFKPWENPQKPGRYYTKELETGYHVVTCISNKRKKLNLEQLAKDFNLDLKVNYEYIKR